MGPFLKPMAVLLLAGQFGSRADEDVGEPGGGGVPVAYQHSESWRLLSHSVHRQVIVFVDTSASDFRSQILPELQSAAATLGKPLGATQKALVVYIAVPSRAASPTR